ncbi:armadillo-type protein [Amylostereum chailletii]|nr:armadillo-type protein [Amylostereum chailletii]
MDSLVNLWKTKTGSTNSRTHVRSQSSTRPSLTRIATDIISAPSSNPTLHTSRSQTSNGAGTPTRTDRIPSREFVGSGTHRRQESSPRSDASSPIEGERHGGRGSERLQRRPAIKSKDKRDRVERSGRDAGQAAGEDTLPAWYLQRLKEHTLVGSQSTALLESLRRDERDWTRRFVEGGGLPALGNALTWINGRGVDRQDAEHPLECGILACLRHILRIPASRFLFTTYTRNVEAHNDLVSQVTRSLNSPRVATRKLVVELLNFLAHWDDGVGLQAVLVALTALTEAMAAGNSPYAYWFKSMAMVIAGRGTADSLAGEGEGVNETLGDYALHNLRLINGVLKNMDDLSSRLEHRATMESDGLDRIIALCHKLRHGALAEELEALQKHKILDEKRRGVLEARVSRASADLHLWQEQTMHDERELQGRLYMDILRDMMNLEDMSSALQERTNDTEAHGYLLSMLQRLLHIPKEGTGLVHCYQLIDSLVADVITDMDSEDAGKGSLQPRSTSPWTPTPRYPHPSPTYPSSPDADGSHGGIARRPSKRLHILILTLRRELEESREHANRLQLQLATQKARYEGQIAELEDEIRTLIRLLKQVEGVIDDILRKDDVDRGVLVDVLRRLQHIPDEVEWSAAKRGRESHATTPTPSRPSTTASHESTMSSTEEALNGRVSQLIDADEAHVHLQAHRIRRQLKTGRRILREVLQGVLLIHRGLHDRSMPHPYGSRL